MAMPAPDRLITMTTAEFIDRRFAGVGQRCGGHRVRHRQARALMDGVSRAWE